MAAKNKNLNFLNLVFNLLAVIVLITVVAACRSCQPTYEFGYEAPIKEILFDSPFPNDLIYQATTDAKVIVGKKDARSPMEQANGVDAPYYEISGFEVETGKQLWQLPFQGAIVGQTEMQILVYEAKTYSLHFVNPANGQVTRTVSPAPNPLLSRNSLEYGMAFSDDFYLTTKALYTSIYENAADWENRREDESFKIGITAKSWKDNKTKWFAPPVKQIVIIENRPVILSDKVFILNPPQTIDGDQTYQIVSLATGAEIFRGATDGKFFNIGKDTFIEQTDSFVRRFEPLTNAEIWKAEGNFHNAAISAIGDQLTIAAPHENGFRTITLLEATTGKSLRPEFEFPPTYATPLKGCFLTSDDKILCNFAKLLKTNSPIYEFNYLISYDAATQKVLWRTDLSSESAISLFSFASSKARFE